MSDLAIRVDGLSKQYRIGAAPVRYRTLRDSIASMASAPVRAVSAAFNRHSDAVDEGANHFWALKDISFDVQQGEVIGLIGRNGAGKSTLLKVLTRITEPTEGWAEIRGRVGSLLEVGTGFHPELTGRENVFLNGAILGMGRTEITRRFDEIVAFAEVQKFIDTPVKHYSSGMYLRLAFAVAAFLETEVLLVDEVLAVGDAQFQKKCLGKMEDVAGKGRTVLFVSHNMAAVNQLCTRCILLDAGRVGFDGTASAGVDRYLRMGSAGEQASIFDLEGAALQTTAIGKGRITHVETRDHEGVSGTTFGIGDPITIVTRIVLGERLQNLSMGFQVESLTGIPLLNLRTDSQGMAFGPYEAGDEVTFTTQVPGLPFYPGMYKVAVWFGERGGKRIDQIHDCLRVTIESKGRFLSERMIQNGRGVVMMDCDWSDSTA